MQGLLDPARLQAGGDRLEVEAAAMAECLGTGPYIFNLGHGIHKDTPPEHVAALIDALRNAPPPAGMS